ncbi:MAG TPA: hypothetical protein VFQ45_07525 [Longimicrobium sp.]|nr:hypothetical protein [Longimicrobium sp.]
MRAPCRRLTPLLIALAAALAAALGAGCASGGPGGSGQSEDRFQVTVENNGYVASSLRITLLPASGGGEYNLGLMTTVGSETLSIQRPYLTGSFRLRAQTNTSRQALHSPPFRLRGGGSVDWDLQRNFVRRRR